MKINAVSVSSSDLRRTVSFYSLLGFQFDEAEGDGGHLEPRTPDGSARLMIDEAHLVQQIIGEAPRAGNTSGFAIEYDSPAELDEAANRVATSGFTIVREPWDAFWGQRYAIVQDPDGYRLDLYARLPAAG